MFSVLMHATPSGTPSSQPPMANSSMSLVEDENASVTFYFSAFAHWWSSIPHWQLLLLPHTIVKIKRKQMKDKKTKSVSSERWGIAYLADAFDRNLKLTLCLTMTRKVDSRLDPRKESTKVQYSGSNRKWSKLATEIFEMSSLRFIRYMLHAILSLQVEGCAASLRRERRKGVKQKHTKQNKNNPQNKKTCKQTKRRQKGSDWEGSLQKLMTVVHIVDYF